MTLCLRLFILIKHKGLTERGMLDVPCSRTLQSIVDSLCIQIFILTYKEHHGYVCMLIYKQAFGFRFINLQYIPQHSFVVPVILKQYNLMYKISDLYSLLDIALYLWCSFSTLLHGLGQLSRYSDSLRAERSEARVCGRTLAWVAGSNPARRMDVCVV